MAITTDIDYPAGLPWPTKDAYSVKSVQPFVRTQLASGRARQRRQFTSVPTMFTLTFVFTGDGEAAAFESWFRDALLDGGEWFNCPLKTPIGSQYYVCRFTEMYEGPNPFGICAWKVSAKVEAWERPLLPPGWGLMPDYLINADIFDIAMNDRWPKA